VKKIFIHMFEKRTGYHVLIQSGRNDDAQAVMLDHIMPRDNLRNCPTNRGILETMLEAHGVQEIIYTVGEENVSYSSDDLPIDLKRGKIK